MSYTSFEGPSLAKKIFVRAKRSDLVDSNYTYFECKHTRVVFLTVGEYGAQRSKI